MHRKSPPTAILLSNLAPKWAKSYKMWKADKWKLESFFCLFYVSCGALLTWLYFQGSVTLWSQRAFIASQQTQTHTAVILCCYPLGPRPLHLSAVPALDHPSTLFAAISQEISPNSKQKNAGLFFMMFLYCYFMLNQIKKHELFRHCDLLQDTTAFLTATDFPC